MPLQHAFEHRVGHRADQIGRNLHLVLFFEEALDFAHRHALGLQGDDLLIEAAKPTLALAHKLGFKVALPIPRHLDLQLKLAQRTGLLALMGEGLTVGHGILVRPEHAGDRGFLAHRLARVAQYEPTDWKASSKRYLARAHGRGPRRRAVGAGSPRLDQVAFRALEGRRFGPRSP